MKYLLCICLAVGASLNALAAGSPGDDTKAVQGNWRPVKAESAGQPMTDAVLKSISLKLGNGKYEVFVGGAPDRGTYTLDSASQPKGKTITGTAGPNRGLWVNSQGSLAGRPRLCSRHTGLCCTPPAP